MKIDILHPEVVKNVRREYFTLKNPDTHLGSATENKSYCLNTPYLLNKLHMLTETRN